MATGCGEAFLLALTSLGLAQGKIYRVVRRNLKDAKRIVENTAKSEFPNIQ